MRFVHDKKESLQRDEILDEDIAEGAHARNQLVYDQVADERPVLDNLELVSHRKKIILQ